MNEADDHQEDGESDEPNSDEDSVDINKERLALEQDALEQKEGKLKTTRLEFPDTDQRPELEASDSGEDGIEDYLGELTMESQPPHASTSAKQNRDIRGISASVASDLKKRGPKANHNRQASKVTLGSRKGSKMKADTRQYVKTYLQF